MEKNKSALSPVAIWVFTGVVMLLVQVILGGITRLTGSGLSITEWNIVTGTLPPFTDTQWIAEFHKYQQTPQYQLLNTDFLLSDFKFIFFWEWLHRFWARLIAIVFLIPFIIFLVRNQFKKEMIRPLIFLFLLGALQGAIGWIMVASGLTGDAIYVKPTRLALHFIFALLLIGYAFWFALKLSIPPSEVHSNKSLWRWSMVIFILLFFQLIFGALMAGHRAAPAAATWPGINGKIIPDAMGRYSPAIINVIENRITIHFIHRTLAFLLVLVVITWTLKAFRLPAASRYFRQTRFLPILLILIQALLGIFTVLAAASISTGTWGKFDWLAQLHQVTGMLFLLSMVWMVYLVRGAKS